MSNPEHVQQTLVAVNRSRNETIVADRVVWAGTSKERRKGLLGRSHLPPTEGMYITPCEWIHTVGMKFPIDVAFLDRNGRVLALHRALRPNRLSRPVFRADGVLELAAGRLQETGTVVGDIVEFRESTQAS